MKARGLLTLGVAAVAGLALVIAAHPGGSAPPGTDSRPQPLPALVSHANAKPALIQRASAITHPDPTDRDEAAAGRLLSPATTPAPAGETPEPNEPGATVAASSDLAPTGGEPTGLLSITIKKDSVIGVRLDRAITTETARVDDRVSARVARDVLVDDRPALAAGTCVEGRVAVLEGGSRSMDRVRIGIRFTTIVLADGRRVPLQVDTIFRESDPTDDAATTSGRSALNAFLAGGMTRQGPARAQPTPANPARRDFRIPAGSLLTMKLTAPVVIER